MDGRKDNGPGPCPGRVIPAGDSRDRAFGQAERPRGGRRDGVGHANLKAPSRRPPTTQLDPSDALPPDLRISSPPTPTPPQPPSTARPRPRVEPFRQRPDLPDVRLPLHEP